MLSKAVNPSSGGCPHPRKNDVRLRVASVIVAFMELSGVDGEQSDRDLRQMLGRARVTKRRVPHWTIWKHFHNRGHKIWTTVESKCLNEWGLFHWYNWQFIQDVTTPLAHDSRDWLQMDGRMEGVGIPANLHLHIPSHCTFTMTF